MGTLSRLYFVSYHANLAQSHISHCFFFFFSSSRRHTRFDCHWSSDVCSSDLSPASEVQIPRNPPRKESGDRLKQKGPFPDSEEGVERVTRERYIVVGTPVQMGASIIRACSAVLDRKSVV